MITNYGEKGFAESELEKEISVFADQMKEKHGCNAFVVMVSNGEGKEGRVAAMIQGELADIYPMYLGLRKCLINRMEGTDEKHH